jgi:hypothetical protein
MGVHAVYIIQHSIDKCFGKGILPQRSREEMTKKPLFGH